MMRRLALACALIAPLAMACGDKKSKPAAPPPTASDAAVPKGPGAPVWTATIEGDVPAVVDWGGGPARVGDAIVVASAVFGVADIDPDSGAVKVRSRADETLIQRQARSLGARMPGTDPDLIAAVPMGGDSIVLVTRSSVARFPAVKSATQPAAVWEHAYDERADLGVAGPVLAEGHLITVVDELLIGRRWDSGAINWRGEDRYSDAAGSIAWLGGALRAVSIDGGVGPVTVDPRTGTRLTTGETAPGISALAAGWSAAGALVVVVRADSSLRNDAVVGFGADGTRAWLWPLPKRERADHVGVWVDDASASAFVFYDGVRVSKFALPQ